MMEKKTIRQFLISGMLAPALLILVYWLLVNLNMHILYTLLFVAYGFIVLVSLAVVPICTLILLIGWKKFTWRRRRALGVWIVRLIAFFFLFFLHAFCSQLSLQSALDHARTAAKQIQQQCNQEKFCRERIEGWKPIEEGQWVDAAEGGVEWEMVPHSYKAHIKHGIRNSLIYVKLYKRSKEETFLLDVISVRGGRPARRFEGGVGKELIEVKWVAGGNTEEKVIN
ncbi:hypothetical protein ACFL2J_02060 [Candidatus Omnitrophota bacterium]